MVHLLLVIIYLTFISLGLPDALLGCAWPTIKTQLDAPLSAAGIISMIIALGTIFSSLQSDRLTKWMGAGKVTALSVLISSGALFGFSTSNSFLTLCLWAIPYGLGAGGIDAAINNYVAIHYSSRHMSWLHAMWGVGTIVGPYIIGHALTHGMSWNSAYRTISLMQLILAVIVLISLPLWKKPKTENVGGEKTKPLSLKQIFSIKGTRQICLCFFCYCAVEQTAMLWSASYMVLHNGISAEKAASLASMFYIGITAGRLINGFFANRFSDSALIKVGQAVIGLGIITMLLPLGYSVTLVGLIMVGLGCAPIYPSIIHSIPQLFGEEASQAIIGVQMASAYIGTCLMPPLFGLIAQYISVSLLPIYLAVILILMIVMHLKAQKITSK